MQNFKIYSTLNLKSASWPFLLFLLCASFQSFAQKTVSGTVTDPAGTPLLGVNVIVKGTNTGASTDFNGQYEISVDDLSVIVFSYVGFQEKQELVGNRTQIDVALAEDAQSLDEVVVIGYGTQKRSDVNSSISSVNSSDIQDLAQVSVDQMLQGKASGVTVTNNSGKPGSAVSIKIRGTSSLSGTNEPLYVIDGVPISGDATNKSTSGRPVAGGNFSNAGNIAVSPLASISPNDIQSIDILKDASATAIYGSRGANGVVIITTKSGKSGTGKLTFDSFISLQEQSKLLDVMSLQQYAVLQNSLANVYGIEPRTEFQYPQLLGQGTNWQKEIYKTAILKSNQLSISGGKEGVNYYVSGGYTDQQGTVIGSAFKRYTFRGNVDAKVKDWLKMGVNINTGITNEDITLNGQQNGIISTSLLSTPDVAVRNLDGSFAGPPPNGSLGSFINPVASALLRTNNLVRKSFAGNFYGEADIFKGLQYRFEIGGYAEFNENKQFNPTYAWGSAINEIATLDQRNQDSYSINVKNLLTYKTTLGKHNITALVGQEANDSHWKGLSVTGSGFVSNDLKELSVSDADEFRYGGQYKGSQSLYSFLSRVIYDFDTKYSFTASFRADGSSKFATGNKWGYFPAASASWKVSSEPFMEGVDKFVDNIRLRVGYGETGNQQIGNYLYGSTINSLQTGLGQGFLVSNIDNPDLQWETSKQTNIGLDFSLFKNKLSATVEVYKKLSENFLYAAPLPLYLTGGDTYEGGRAAPYINIGKMENKGIDLTLNYNQQFGDNFRWNSSLVLSKYINEVVSIYNESEIQRTVNFNDYTTGLVTNTVSGQPIGQFYGLATNGIIRTEEQLAAAPKTFFGTTAESSVLGDVEYVDQNGDGVINDSDLTFIGNPNPDFTYGFTNTFNYKGIELSIFVQGSQGNDLLNLTRRAGTLNANLYQNQLAEAIDFWSVNNVDAKLPRPVGTLSHPNLRVSDRFVEDGSYLRIQNVTLGYSLPDDVISQLKLTRLRIYASGQNLFTFTDYSGYDPEVGSFNQDALLNGVDNGRYPTPRTITLGVNVEF
ncbi:MAG: TonB-dependent receptor [Leeuwenhoekiella sp.]